MSTKTISKRVALATVVALGAGVLSLVSVSSASAVGTNITVAAGTDPAIAASSTLYIASAQSTDGTSAAITTSTTAAGTLAVTTAKSFGLLSVTDLLGTQVAGTTQTATLLSNGALSVYDSAASGKFDAIVVSGATISAITGTGAVLNGTQTVGIAGDASNPDNWGGVIKPNAGVSSFTVSLYTGAASSDAAVANPTAGTLSGFINVSVATASVAGTVSVTKSGVYYSGIAAGSSVSAVTKDSSSAGIGTSAWNVPQTAAIVLADAYGTQLAASALITASATNGAYVALGASGTATSPASAGSSSAAATLSATNTASLTVAPSVSTASTTTVTVSVNGVVIGTKAFTFTGKVAKVILSAASNGVTGGTGTYTIALADSAGNAVYPTSGSGSYPQTVTKDTLISGIAGNGIGFGSITTYPASGTSGVGTFSCGSNNANGSVAVDYTNVDGSVLASNILAVSCSGTAASYSAKFDKASYNPGDIATLNVTFKDSVGSLAADVASGTGAIASAAAGKTPNIIGSNLTNTSGTATTAGAATDATTNGVATYKFIVGATSGTYAAVVDFPLVDSATQSAVTAAYTIASSGTSLNDVLKGIVSLIASINKQIAALAKLVTKK
jgi:hypothetical protein